MSWLPFGARVPLNQDEEQQPKGVMIAKNVKKIVVTPKIIRVASEVVSVLELCETMGIWRCRYLQA